MAGPTGKPTGIAEQFEQAKDADFYRQSAPPEAGKLGFMRNYSVLVGLGTLGVSAALAHQLNTAAISAATQPRLESPKPTVAQQTVDYMKQAGKEIAVGVGTVVTAFDSPAPAAELGGFSIPNHLVARGYHAATGRVPGASPSNGDAHKVQKEANGVVTFNHNIKFGNGVAEYREQHGANGTIRDIDFTQTGGQPEHYRVLQDPSGRVVDVMQTADGRTVPITPDSTAGQRAQQLSSRADESWRKAQGAAMDRHIDLTPTGMVQMPAMGRAPSQPPQGPSASTPYGTVPVQGVRNLRKQALPGNGQHVTYDSTLRGMNYAADCTVTRDGVAETFTVGNAVYNVQFGPTGQVTSRGVARDGVPAKKFTDADAATLRTMANEAGRVLGSDTGPSAGATAKGARQEGVPAFSRQPTGFTLPPGF